MTDESRTTGKFILKGSGSNFVGTDHSSDNFEKLLGIYSTREKAEAALIRAKKHYTPLSDFSDGKCDYFWIEEPADAYDVDVDLWEFGP